MSLTNSYENAILDHMFNKTPLIPPTSLYIGLSSSDIDDTTGVVGEFSGGNYARASIGSWGAASSRSIDNDNDITFNTASASWGTISSFMIMTSSTGSDMLSYGKGDGTSVSTGDTLGVRGKELELVFDSSSILTTYMANEVLEHITNAGGSASFPSTFYIGLSNTTILDDGTGETEPSGNGYARVASTSSDWGYASGGSISNSSILSFPTPTGSWGTITYVFIADASTGGNILLKAPLSVATSITSGNSVAFPVSGQVWELD